MGMIRQGWRFFLVSTGLRKEDSIMNEVVTPILKNHGGDCCGIKSIHCFVPRDSVFRAGDFQAHINRFNDLVSDCQSRQSRADPDNCLCLEVVLTARQLKDWQEIVEARGFRCVTQFRNINSDNMCYVFHWYRKPDLRSYEPDLLNKSN